MFFKDEKPNQSPESPTAETTANILAANILKKLVALEKDFVDMNEALSNNKDLDKQPELVNMLLEVNIKLATINKKSHEIAFLRKNEDTDAEVHAKLLEIEEIHKNITTFFLPAFMAQLPKDTSFKP